MSRVEDSLEEALKNYFNLPSFRNNQKKIVSKILDKENLLVLMPTGAGKSLCYQLPALLAPKMTVVISPLISLMNEQVHKLRNRGIEAGYLNSSLDYDRYRKALSMISRKKIKLLYVSPETLQKKIVVDILFQVGVSFVAIDEAHCISQWGHDFRPGYRLIQDFLSNFKGVTCAAFTATATDFVVKDILKILKINQQSVIRSSFNRPNLQIYIENPNSVEDIKASLYRLCLEFKNKSGIIYCSTRNKVEKTTKDLKALGIKKVRAYHAGFDTSTRQKCHQDFLDDKVYIVVATIAFGMGIDKPNVRFVVHMDIPKNLESYYQEIGRAGRDGKTSKCLLFFEKKAIKRIEYLIQNGEKDENQEKIALKQLSDLSRFCMTNSCRKKVLQEYFSEETSGASCKSCDNCLSNN